MEQQFHHYIPRFILRKYASKEKNTKMFTCGANNSIELSTKPKNKKKNPNKNPYINVITSDGVLKKEKISILYGVTNMYKDPKAEVAMEVEKLLATIESDVAGIFQRIITDEAAQRDIKLTRQELYLIKKFNFVMTYRKDRRRNQYVNNDFDFLTGMAMQKFMKDYKIESPQMVWLNNIRAILEEPDLEQLVGLNDIRAILEEPDLLFERLLGLCLTQSQDTPVPNGSIPLFPVIRMDLYGFLCLFFVCFWKAPPGTEFLISNCIFGLWEGSEPFVDHQFYPVSPSIMLVQCSVRFRNDEIGQRMSTFVKNHDALPSWFENVPHPMPKDFYKKTGHQLVLDLSRVDHDPRDPLDECVYSFVEIPKEAINRINAITIDESVQISFSSELVFYKSLKYYTRVRHEMPNGKVVNVKPMVQGLLKNLRKDCKIEVIE